MNPVLETLITVVIGALLGGSSILGMYRARLQTAIAGEQNQQSANDKTMLTFYTMWNDELIRLRREIDELHMLVVALEQEIIVLGGDPVRIRIELAKSGFKE